MSSKKNMETQLTNIEIDENSVINEYALQIRSMKYEKLLTIQRKPVQAIYFKDQEISAKKLIEILENADIK
jgi:hypothetical protein